MPVKFSDVVASPNFQQLGREDKYKVAERYFQNVVFPAIKDKSPDDIKAITDRFYSTAESTIGGAQATEIRAEYPSEKFARYAEPISQFAGMLKKAPGPGIALAAGATLGTEAARQIIQKVGGEPRGQNIPISTRARMLGEAGLRGATTETIGRVIGKGMEGMAELPVIKPAVEKIATAPEKMSARTINSLIKPKSKAFLYGKNPGEGVVEEGIIATSLEDLGKKVTAKKQEIGKMYEPLLEQNKDKILDLSEVLKPIDDAISASSSYSRTNKEVIARLKDTRMDLIENLVKRDSTGNWGLSPADALKLKQEIGDITKFTGRESDDKAVNSALQDVYRNIDKKLDEAIPAMKDVNRRWANMLGAEISARERAALLERQNMLHLPEILIGGSGMGLGAITGDPKDAAIYGLGAAGLTKLAGTTAAKTIGAQVASKVIPPVARFVGGKLLPRYIGMGQSEKYFPTSTEELMRKKYMEQK